MPTDLVPALFLPIGMIVFGFLMVRQPLDPRAGWDYRKMGGSLAIIAGLGWLLIGVVRLATTS